MHFSRFLISRDKREKKSLNNFAENFNFWLVKISGQGFSSFFAKFLAFFKVECTEDIVNFEKSS